MPDRFVLVLAGGRGERFWPWSRPERPKQLLPLARGGRSLLAATLDRALALAPPSRVVVLTARDLVEAVRSDCGASGARILGEPLMRNDVVLCKRSQRSLHLIRPPKMMFFDVLREKLSWGER